MSIKENLKGWRAFEVWGNPFLPCFHLFKRCVAWILTIIIINIIQWSFSRNKWSLIPKWSQTILFLDTICPTFQLCFVGYCHNCRQGNKVVQKFDIGLTFGLFSFWGHYLKLKKCFKNFLNISLAFWSRDDRMTLFGTFCAGLIKNSPSLSSLIETLTGENGSENENCAPFPRRGAI